MFQCAAKSLRTMHPGMKEARPTIEKQRNFAVQNFIGDLFASAYQWKKEYFVTPSKEMDFNITVKNKAVLIGEVKWEKYDGTDLKKFVEKTTFIKTEKIFITKNKSQTLRQRTQPQQSCRGMIALELSSFGVC